MTEPFAPLLAALAFAGALEARQVDYAIGGALALSMGSEPRMTNDVVVNVLVEPSGLDPVFDAIEAVGATVDRSLARRQAEDDGLFIARWPSRHPLDLFTPSIEFSHEAARTRVRRRIADRVAWFLSAEGIAIFKLLFFRGKDRVDVERLVQVRPQLDRGYIRQRLVDDLGADDERVQFWDDVVARTTP